MPWSRSYCHYFKHRALFTSLADVREAPAIWKDDYNTIRPHSALGNLPPAVVARNSATETQRAGALRYIDGSAPRPDRNALEKASTAVQGLGAVQKGGKI